MAQLNAQVKAEADYGEVSGQATDDAHQFLTFELVGEVYAIDIMHIREIIDYGNITAVPMVPDFIAGVINLRGSVVPVIDLATRFWGQSTEITKRTSIVIIELSDSDQSLEIGVIVDIVNEVLDIPSEDIEPTPSFGASIRTDFIAGMGKVDGKFMILLDVNRVLSLDELAAAEHVQHDSRVTVTNDAEEITDAA